MQGEEQPVTFDCRGSELLGIAHRARRPVGCVAVFVVGGPQYRVGSHGMFVTMARNLSARGIDVFRFDCRGMGDSDGEFESFEHIGDDIRAAIDEAVEHFACRRVVLLGLCDGASAIALYAATDPRVGAAVLINPWVRTESGEAKARVAKYYRARFLQIDLWRRLLAGKIDLRESIQSLLKNIRSAVRAGGSDPENFVARMLTGLGDFGGAVAVILSAEDLTAQEFAMLLNDSTEWRRLSTRGGFSVTEIPLADHTFSGEGQLDIAFDAVAAAFDRFVGRST